MKPHFSDDQVTLWHGDALDVAREMPSGSVDCIVTSPPYLGLRDYGVDGTDWPALAYAPMAGMPEVTVAAMTCPLGLEPSPAAYVAHLVLLFRELRRVLTDDGCMFLNIGDSYSGSGKGPVGVSAIIPNHAAAIGGKPYLGLPAKNLLGIPWRVAFALQADGWILRNSIVWAKPNAMPESVTDRLSTKHEMVFMFAKRAKYWFDLDAIREPHTSDLPPGYSKTYGEWVRTTENNHNRTGVQGLHENGKNPGDVWEIPTQPFAAAHFACMPRALAERCIQAGCKPGGTVLDPFSGSGTTGLAAARHGRRYVGIDLNREYLDLSLKTRLAAATLDFDEGA